MGVVARLIEWVSLRARKTEAAPADAHPDDDPLSAYAEKLRGLDAQQRGELPDWSADVLAFVDFMDGVTWSGSLVAACNQWANGPRLLAALKLMGEHEASALLAQARTVAVERGHADADRCNAETAQDDEAVFEAFQAAEAVIEARWVEMWDRAEAYARANGWAPPARSTAG